MYEEKFIKRKIANLQIRKNEESKQRKETNSNDKKTFMRIHIILEIYVYR